MRKRTGIFRGTGRIKRIHRYISDLDLQGFEVKLDKENAFFTFLCFRKENERMERLGLWKIIICGLLFYLLFRNYSGNAFAIILEDWFSGWQTDSESIVISSIENARSRGIWCDYGMLGNYHQQIGLQGLAFKILDHITQRPWIPVNFFINL